MKTKPIILIEQSGARLWPKSRSKFPKQFKLIIDNNSLFDLALKIFNLLKYSLTTSKKIEFLVRNFVENLKFKSSIVLDPFGEK